MDINQTYMVIILQYIQTPNHEVVHRYVNVISIYKKFKKQKTKQKV